MTKENINDLNLNFFFCIFNFYNLVLILKLAFQKIYKLKKKKLQLGISKQKNYL